MTCKGKGDEPSEAHFASNSPTGEDLLAPNPASHLSPKQKSRSPSEPSSLKCVCFKMEIAGCYVTMLPCVPYQLPISIKSPLNITLPNVSVRPESPTNYYGPGQPYMILGFCRRSLRVLQCKSHLPWDNELIKHKELICSKCNYLKKLPSH